MRRRASKALVDLLLPMLVATSMSEALDSNTREDGHQLGQYAGVLASYSRESAGDGRREASRTTGRRTVRVGTVLVPYWTV